MCPLPGRARFVRAGAVLFVAAVLLAAPAAAQTISFGKSTLQGTALTSPTSLQFGPDGRLYVTQQNGTILIYTITRNAPNSYVVSATQTITSIRDIPNHDDNGPLNGSITGREVTGILVVGTAANPVIYVASSDPRIGAGGSGTDSNLDTNSGILSRLTWNGSTWVKLDLVRGLPRSEENHASNGLVLINSGATLLIAQGGNTNMGAPSNNFALLPEYALSAAILSVNLTAIGNTTYDLPTLDDPLASRNTGTPGVDLNDPFGGNDGANQAKLVAGGPVQVYSPGYRNPYDLVVTRAGRLYTVDNGPNSGWGDVPAGEGGTTCTNATREPGVTQSDQLHYVTGQGFYAGHPNPTRANTANTFNGQSPVSSSNSVECDYRNPGAQDGALATFAYSTNGLAEYTANNFAGVMDGNLLAASFENSIYRIVLSANGATATSVTTLFSSVGNTPLDVWTQGNAGPFPGSIWVADYGINGIVVYEPADFVSCTGADNAALDEDGDGFSNADEIDNGTNPCSAGDVPPDWDGDHLSNLNDPDDDNDGLPDTSDKFALDPQNGATTSLPLLLTWDNDAPNPGGLLHLGFTGLMSNGTSNYESLFNAGAMTAGGAAGVVTVDAATEGDADGALNTQQFGFQVGVHVTAATGIFTAHTRILAPFAGLTPADFQSMGLFIGTGDQDHYAKVVVMANGGAGGVQFGKEDGGPLVARTPTGITLPGPDWIDLYLTIDPVALAVTPVFIATINNVPGPVESLGGPATLPASWLAGPQGLAVGIISTSRGPAPPFPVTWDFLKVRAGAAVECSADPDCADTNPCTTDVCQSYTCLHLNNTNPCNDGLSCTSGDICAAGSCTGTDACPAGQMCDASSNACLQLNVDLDNDGLVGAADPCPTSARNLCFGPVATETAQGRTLRINTGDDGTECAGPKTDCTGRLWNGDYGFNNVLNNASCDLGGGGEGCVISGITSIFGCEDESTEDLFQCEHYDDEGGTELQYSFAVPNGAYLVNLYFANTSTGTTSPGSRVFNILVEGATAYASFDQVVASGGSGIAIVRSKVVNVADGALNISFGHVTENPALKAIEVLRQDRDGDGFFPPNDCNDLNAAVHPGATDTTCNGVDENCSGVADEGYAPVGTACGIGPCARTGVTSCVAGAVHDSCTPGAPQPEVCDGVDNNCNAIIDDAPPLGTIATLDVTTGALASDASLSWASVPGASAYDLVRGNVRTLVEGGGSFATAIDQCLANNTTAQAFVESGMPAAGEAFFYVLRGVNCGGGSWDEGGSQAVPRGPSFAAAPAACP
ncbi:MAG TPA: malectin domain-containing carbohydrate-binding protein [Candidatus Polarisedimenticolia bacterium]|nr:malectin domain-containing carbohydrate-binding protein [Candidatus Polarisedimenticolia bacterium]